MKHLLKETRSILVLVTLVHVVQECIHKEEKSVVRMQQVVSQEVLA